jgi:Fur family transcriptional regulator, ferric uptake regulator
VAIEWQCEEVRVDKRTSGQEYLSNKGMRMTRERLIVVDEMFAANERFDPEQLILRVASRMDGRRVSRSTVYRALSLLEEAGMLRRIVCSDGREVYEHN